MFSLESCDFGMMPVTLPSMYLSWMSPLSPRVDNTSACVPQRNPQSHQLPLQHVWPSSTLMAMAAFFFHLAHLGGCVVVWPPHGQASSSHCIGLSSATSPLPSPLSSSCMPGSCANGIALPQTWLADTNGMGVNWA